MTQSIFFVGIGGSGMNAIARLMNFQGYAVSGSDRDFDLGNRPDFYSDMINSGIRLFRQDGSGINHQIDAVVVSTAIEDTIPDIKKAIEMHIPVIHRSQALQQLIESKRSVAIAGTSGKSTVTGMCAWGLKQLDLDPTVVNGARILGLGDGSSDVDILAGHGHYAIYEADESDGSLTRFRPDIGIVTNITKDHKSLNELKSIFISFISHVQDTVIMNSRCPVTCEVASHARQKISFGINRDDDFQMTDISLETLASQCRVENQILRIELPGFHNLENAIAAYSLLRHIGQSPEASAGALRSFRGIERRFQIIGENRGVTVVDDFAHNPDKIRATMTVCQRVAPRVVYIYQPHGYGPTRFLFDELTSQLSAGLRDRDDLILAPIFYAGGTAQKDISSDDLAEQIVKLGGRARVFHREVIPDQIARIAKSGDWVIVMGARDPSLPSLCQRILDTLHESEETHFSAI